MDMIGYMFKMINDGYFFKKSLTKRLRILWPRLPLRLWPQFWPGPTGRRAASCRLGGPGGRDRQGKGGQGENLCFFWHKNKVIWVWINTY